MEWPVSDSAWHVSVQVLLRLIKNSMRFASVITPPAIWKMLPARAVGNQRLTATWASQNSTSAGHPGLLWPLFQ